MKCAECGLTFSNVIAMEDHLSLMHDHNKYYCEECEMAFLTDVRLMKHDKHNHPEKIETCNACGNMIKSTENSSVHQLDCVKIRRYGCGDCKMGFKNWGGLKRHQKTSIHQGFICRPCYLEFENADLFRNHMAEDIGLNLSNKCRTCGKQFDHSRNLYRHERYTHGKEPQMCHLCGWRSSRKESYLMHMKFHKTGGHICDLCKIPCMTKVKLNSHKVLHLPSVCHICHRVFLGLGGLRRHIKKTHPEHSVEYPVMQFTCLGCNMVFLNMKRAEQHLDRKPSCRKHHVCNYCREIFHSIEQLDKHKTIHKGPYICSYCNRGFIKWDKCSQHMTMHVEITGGGAEKLKDTFKQEQEAEEQQEAELKLQEINKRA